ISLDPCGSGEESAALGVRDVVADPIRSRDQRCERCDIDEVTGVVDSDDLVRCSRLAQERTLQRRASQSPGSAVDPDLDLRGTEESALGTRRRDRRASSDAAPSVRAFAEESRLEDVD
ncbi:hypothetical protein, partial [Clavibacter michiganensis]|uniref:hypothetical protein n=1 Tax=Clavibacter michiganensis TaxID=28447 RepID=UPI00292D8A41